MNIKRSKRQVYRGLYVAHTCEKMRLELVRSRLSSEACEQIPYSKTLMLELTCGREGFDIELLQLIAKKSIWFIFLTKYDNKIELCDQWYFVGVFVYKQILAIPSIGRYKKNWQDHHTWNI
jgi:hypothetical protein